MRARRMVRISQKLTKKTTCENENRLCTKTKTKKKKLLSTLFNSARDLINHGIRGSTRKKLCTKTKTKTKKLPYTLFNSARDIKLHQLNSIITQFRESREPCNSIGDSIKLNLEGAHVQLCRHLPSLDPTVTFCLLSPF